MRQCRTCQRWTAKCPRVSSVTAHGWKAYRADDPEEDEPPQLAFCCPGSRVRSSAATNSCGTIRS